MGDFFRVVIGRLIGAGVGAATGYLGAKGVGALDQNSADALVTYTTNVAMLAGYGIAHKLTDRKVNPTDVAKEAKK